MLKYISIFPVLICCLAVLTGCTISNERLAKAEEQTPTAKIDQRIHKYVDQLYSNDTQQRAWGAYNIGKHGKRAKSAVNYLVALLNDNEVVVLDRYIGRNFTSSITTTPADEAAKALAKIGLPALKPLLKALQDKNPLVVEKVIKALGLIQNNKAIKPLISFLAQDNKILRLSAANSLSRFRGPWVVEHLLTNLEDSNPQLRAMVSYTLGKIKSPASIYSLVKVLQTDQNPQVQTQVIIALSKFNNQRVIKPLLNALNNKNRTNRVEVARALANIRDYRVVTGLINVMDENNYPLKQAAAESLSVITGTNLGIKAQKWRRWWRNKSARMKRNR